MLKVTATDGAVFHGATAQEVVRAMRNTQWNAPVLKRDWMEEVAERVEQMTGERPRTRAREFLADLKRLGLVTIEHVQMH